MRIKLETYKNKRVLITGNTGFKGAWLSYWLHLIGAKVYGYSINIPTKPSLFNSLNLESKITQKWADVRDKRILSNYIKKIKPDYIFHLAAQSIVKTSFDKPFDTFNVNTFGTLNLLEILRLYSSKVNIVIITSDKSYKNIEQLWGYKEIDAIGGDDPYSASKGATEIIINSYFQSYIKNYKNIHMAVARAGNVIGGGDWSHFRLIPDAIKSWSKNIPLNIRSPNSTRPWQHVLEPLYGYLILGLKISSSKKINGESFNFGPRFDQNFSVMELLKESSYYWKNSSFICKKNKSFKESSLLKLNCEKAALLLDWEPTLNFKDTIRLTFEWYRAFIEKKNMEHFTKNQINYYERLRKID